MIEGGPNVFDLNGLGWAAPCAVAFLGGCSNMILFVPKGPNGDAERFFIIAAFVLMLIVVVPVISQAIMLRIISSRGDGNRPIPTSTTVNPASVNSPASGSVSFGVFVCGGGAKIATTTRK
jgi:heme/copper-type cytochrome/quinol oxidase subunit 2